MKIRVNNITRTYLQSHYGNGVFGNVYLSTGQYFVCRHPIAVMRVVDMLGQCAMSGTDMIIMDTSEKGFGPSLMFTTVLKPSHLHHHTVLCTDAIMSSKE